MHQAVEKPADSKQRTHNLDRVAAPREAEIRKILDAQEWTNPFIVVCSEGYELILHGVPRSERRLTGQELEATLVSLPVSRWPLGKVVAVPVNGHETGRDEPLHENRKALEAMLKRLGVSGERWPGA